MTNQISTAVAAAELGLTPLQTLWLASFNVIGVRVSAGLLSPSLLSDYTTPTGLTLAGVAAQLGVSRAHVRNLLTRKDTGLLVTVGGQRVPLTAGVVVDWIQPPGGYVAGGDDLSLAAVANPGPVGWGAVAAELVDFVSGIVDANT